MLTILNSIILGVVEGFTEFLPISSTAHLILVSDALKIVQLEYVKSFEIVIQSGAILAVVFLYWKKLWNWEVIKRLVVAFIPTGILGLLLYGFIKTYLIGNFSVIMWSLFLGGILLIVFERLISNSKSEGIAQLTDISYKQCLGLGLFQSIAMIPGVSRAAATIIGGMLLGISRRTIVEFSFLLAVPTMIAATGLDLVKNLDYFNDAQIELLAIGFAASFIMAIISIKLLLNYIKRHNFTSFGVYRIALVLGILIFMLFAR